MFTSHLVYQLHQLQRLDGLHYEAIGTGREGQLLVATDRGVGVIGRMHEEVKSPIMTGEWEAELAKVQRGLTAIRDEVRAGTFVWDAAKEDVHMNVEAALTAHPSIAQVAVIGVPDERMGEVGCACVVLRPGEALDERGLIAWSRERMANYKVPRFVRFFASLPVNASNKVVKNELRALVRVPA